MKKNICLGIESTAHTFGVGIVCSDGAVLANERAQMTTGKGGLIPAAVADHHCANAPRVLAEAMQKARPKDIGLIAFSQGPGMGGPLGAGAVVARTLSQLWDVPLVGVNHCIAHLEVGRLRTKAEDPVFLYVSGANTQVIAHEGGDYRILGESLDIGAGNFLDAFARHLGLGFPGGPLVEKEAALSKTYIDLPYAVKGMDVSFSGLLTSLKTKIAKGGFSRADLCFSAQETAFAMLVEVAERAMAHTGKRELLLGGGVACNRRLQEMCRIMCEERDAKLFVPEREFLVDNGAMIAWNGLLSYKAGKRTPLKKSIVRPYLRIGESLF